MYGRGYQSPGMGFGPPVTPPVIKQLLIANAVLFVLSRLSENLAVLGALIPKAFWNMGYLWQPFTYMWLHANLLHLAMNMFVLWMFGSQLALVWGARRFLRYYLICGVGAGLFIATVPYFAVATGGNPVSLLAPTVGASGAVYAVVLAYSLTWPDRTIMLIFPPVAFRAIWIIPVMFFMTWTMDGGNNISHTGHLGGVVVGWLYLRRRGEAGRLFSFRQLKNRWHRYRMRQKLRAVRYEEMSSRRRRDDDHTYH